MKLKVKHFFKRLSISVMRSRQRRANEMILMQLSDRDLADIGIYRCDIPSIVAGKKK